MIGFTAVLAFTACIWFVLIASSSFLEDDTDNKDRFRRKMRRMK